MSNDVPLLSAEVCRKYRNEFVGGLSPQTTIDFLFGLNAIASGRAIVVPRMSEAEARERFQAHWCPPDHDEAPEFHIHKQFAADAYLAALRDIGAIRD